MRNFIKGIIYGLKGIIYEHNFMDLKALFMDFNSFLYISIDEYAVCL